MRVVVTRPEPGLSRTTRRLHEEGYEPVALPLTRIVPIETGIDEAAGTAADAYIATSAAALRLAGDRLDRQRPIWVVGAATAEAARSAGFRDIIQGPGDGSGLAERIAADTTPASQTWLYLAGRVRSPELETRLADAGLTLRVAEIYDARPIRYDSAAIVAALTPPPAAVLFYSSAAAAAFGAMVEQNSVKLERTLLLCLSPAVATPLAGIAGSSTLVAARPEEAVLLRLLAELRNQRD